MSDTVQVEEKIIVTTAFVNLDRGETRAESLVLETFTETEEGAIITGVETASGSKIKVTFEYNGESE